MIQTSWKFEWGREKRKEEKKTKLLLYSKENNYLGIIFVSKPPHMREGNWELTIVKWQLILTPYGLWLMPV